MGPSRDDAKSRCIDQSMAQWIAESLCRSVHAPPNRSIPRPTQPLPTACRATPSPARSAQPPSSGDLPGGWCPARPGSPRRRKVVLRTMAVFKDNICHGLGFNQFVTNIIFKNAYGSTTPKCQPRSAPGRWLGHPAPADPGLLSCKLRRTLLVLTVGPGSRRQPGKTATRPQFRTAVHTAAR